MDGRRGLIGGKNSPEQSPREKREKGEKPQHDSACLQFFILETNPPP